MFVDQLSRLAFVTPLKCGYDPTMRVHCRLTKLGRVLNAVSQNQQAYLCPQ